MSGFRLARNSALLLAAQVVSRLATLVTFMLVARAFQPAALGGLTFALSLAGWLGLCTDLGLDLVLARSVARQPEQTPHALHRVVWLKTRLFAALLVPYTVAAVALGDSVETQVAALLVGVTILAEAINRSYGAVALAEGRAGYQAATEIGVSVGRTLVVSGTVLAGGGLLQVAGSYALAAFLCIALLWAWTGKRPHRLLRETGEPSRPLLTEGMTFAAYGVLFQLYFRSDMMLLAAMRPMDDLARYAVAYRVLEALLMVPAALSGPLYPFLCREYAAGGTARLADSALSAVRWIALIGGLLVVTFWAAAPEVTLLVGGAQYEGSSLLLRILLVALFFIALNCTTVLVQNAVGRPRANSYAMATGAVVNVSANLALLGTWGPQGAALVTVLTEAIVTAVLIWLARDVLSPARWSLAVLPAMAATACALVATWLTPGAPVWLRVPMAPLAMFTVCWLLGGIDTTRLRRLFAEARGPGNPVGEA